MAISRKHRRVKSKPAGENKLPFHAFWSGALSFGLVNVPVLVFPASRNSGVRLRMISSSGVPLARRYFCPRDGREMGSDEIVRGYEIDDGTYITVTDDELEALEPQKSREIELREFVNLDAVAPAYMERGYYLTPGKGAAKAYRLLADVMEKTQRAGIATFVMRDREYLVVIFAQNGILCAETLRFHEEVRDPQTVGLPRPVAPPRQRISAFERSISALTVKTLSLERLVDRDRLKVEAIIARKKKAGKDLVRTNNRPKDADSKTDDDVDLLDTIRRSLRRVDTSRNGSRHRAKPSGNGGPAHHKEHRKRK